eukprot:10832398-Ditylum_brightwellii.AAC.1
MLQLLYESPNNIPSKKKRLQNNSNGESGEIGPTMSIVYSVVMKSRDGSEDEDDKNSHNGEKVEVDADAEDEDETHCDDKNTNKNKSDNKRGNNDKEVFLHE